VALIVLTLVFSSVDGFLTLKLVKGNIRELNPVMAFFLQSGPREFLLVKSLLSAFGLTVLLILKNHYILQRRVRLGAVLVIIPVLYLVLITYEIVIL